MAKTTTTYNGEGRVGAQSFDRDGMAHYIVPDFQGNTAMDIDALCNVVQETHYYPYGEPWSQPQGQPWLFGGKERERRHRLGDSDFGARTYNAARATFAQPDPLAESYYPINPYTFCAADPINHIDPTGMKWVNPSDSIALQEDLTHLLDSCQKELSKKENKLNEKKSAGKDYSKLSSEIEDLSARISLIEKSKSYVERLGQDKHLYSLGRTVREQYFVRKGEKNEVIIEASELFARIHEIVHIVQSLDFGWLRFLPDSTLANPGFRELSDGKKISTRMIDMEVEAYTFQYAIKPGSLPSEIGIFTGTIKDVTAKYVENIRDSQGNKVYDRKKYEQFDD